MYQAMLLDRIQQLRSLVVCDERAIARQQRVVAALQKVGEGAIYAKRLLANFEGLRRRHIDDQRRSEKELTQIWY